MKIRSPFRLRRTVLALILVATGAMYAQDNTGNKPELVAPSAAAAATMAEHAGQAHKDKTPSTTLTISLRSETRSRLPTADNSLPLGAKALILTASDLAALPHETVTAVNGHTNASETYSGIPIAVLLARLGLPFEKKNEPTLLKTYLVAQGTDGYRVLISAYETLSTIRGSNAIVADALSTPEGMKPLTGDGAFKLVIPGDKRPQRWVQNLQSITLTTID